jgi:hypothetical protein
MWAILQDIHSLDTFSSLVQIRSGSQHKLDGLESSPALRSLP